jgi:hypothetical protein
MATERQIEANRLNAQKCTGPRSAEGKARSSMNALKTGIDANTRIIAGEDPAGLAVLIKEYHDRWLPTTPEQRLLVDTLVTNDWLLRRLNRVESQLWEHRSPPPDFAHPQVALAHALLFEGVDFDRVQRRMNSAQRNFQSALRDLERLKAREAEHEPESEPEPAPQPIEQPATSLEIGFVPQPPPTIPANPVPLAISAAIPIPIDHRALSRPPIRKLQAPGFFF